MKTLSPLVLLAFISTGLVACCSAAHPPDPPPPVTDYRTTAERAEDKSVTLLDPEDNSPECGGVWISRTRIITKSHCVKKVGRPAIYAMVEGLGLDPRAYGLMPEWNPVGQKVTFTQRDGSEHPSIIEAIDTDDAVDLALLNVLVDVPEHDIAYVSDRELRDGEPLDVVGATASHAFTYSHCYVAATHLDWLQVSGPVFFGNSGGGAFDERGALVGIADHVEQTPAGWVPGMSFFSTGRAIREFVTAAEAK